MYSTTNFRFSDNTLWQGPLESLDKVLKVVRYSLGVVVAIVFYRFFSTTGYCLFYLTQVNFLLCRGYASASTCLISSAKTVCSNCAVDLSLHHVDNIQ